MNPLMTATHASGAPFKMFAKDDPAVEERYRDRYDQVARRTDRLFLVLMIAQWAFGIAVSLLISPYAWAGQESTLHQHVYAAIFLGGAISALPIFMILKYPGRASTRYVVAVGQMLWSALLIHLTGGRIETHFHVFGSLAVLAFYRDVRVLIPATLVVAADHFLRQIFWPESAYATSTPEWWRFLEHAGWVVFENIFLTLNCIYATNELRQICQQEIDLQRQRNREAQANTELQEDIVQLLSVVADASDGDLTARAKVTAGTLGNVADAFNSLLESMQRFMGQVTDQIEKTNQAVASIRESSGKMAHGAATQAKEVQSATQLVEKMSSEITRVSESATHAAEAAKRTEASAQEGSKVVQDIINGMSMLRANVQAGAKRMKSLGDRSMEITGIVSTISKISEQTNMLALNASIEAARAGEQGRGFSVVAEEVRKLAERTATATKEIDALVKAIHAETNNTAAAIEEQTHVVEEESKVVGKAGASLSRIRTVSSESATIVVNISNVARQQAEGTSAVVRAMEQIQTIAQQTRRGVEGTTATAAQLWELSEQLQKTISQFKVA